MIGFIFLTYRFLEPIAEFTEVLDQTQTAVAGLRRVLGVLDLPVGPPPPSTRVRSDGRLDIDVRDVTFSYPTRGLASSSDDAVLRHVTAYIPAGQQVALVGATGSGKTTLGRLIARFADPTIGEVCIGGVSLRYVSNEELRCQLVVVSQEPFLFNGTIAANVGFARPGTSVDDVAEIVARLDLEEWIDSLPDGLTTDVGQRGDQLSAGERQLVALLRAGIADPDVLVLDEATSSVGALTEVRISRALAHLAEGRTTIAIAHRMSTAAAPTACSCCATGCSSRTATTTASSMPGHLRRARRLDGRDRDVLSETPVLSVKPFVVRRFLRTEAVSPGRSSRAERHGSVDRADRAVDRRIASPSRRPEPAGELRPFTRRYVVDLEALVPLVQPALTSTSTE